MLKRTIDVVISLLLLIPAIPVMLILSIIIRLSSKGSPLFMQERIGQYQQPFKCLKLRTLYRFSPEISSHELDPRHITKPGTVIRQLKLDELPQLFNVLAGTMSLVGPRPCLPSQKGLIVKREKLDVFCIKPGITGLAQIMGVGTEDANTQAKLDGDYVKKSSIYLDARILFLTIFVMRVK